MFDLGSIVLRLAEEAKEIEEKVAEIVFELGRVILTCLPDGSYFW